MKSDLFFVLFVISGYLGDTHIVLEISFWYSKESKFLTDALSLKKIGLFQEKGRVSSLLFIWGVVLFLLSVTNCHYLFSMKNYCSSSHRNDRIYLKIFIHALTLSGLH